MAAVVLASGVSACAEPTVDAPPPRLTPEFVTGAAAAALQSDGRFAFDASVINPPGELSHDQATTIASHYVREMAPSLVGFWSRYHRRAIDPALLEPCDRPLYAANAYESLSGNYSEITERTFGPHWVVPMCGPDGQPQVVVSFSSLATELTDILTLERVPWERGNFTSFGIPVSAARWMYSAEQATADAYARSGRRIQSVPQLIMSPRPESPVLVRWRIELEDYITVAGQESSHSRERKTLFVGFGEQFSRTGLLDLNPNVSREPVSWTDPWTQSEVRAALSPLAPAGIEVVRRVGR